MNGIMKTIKSLEGSATDVAIHKKMFGSGMTELIISSEEMNAILKIIKSLEGSVLLIKSISEIIKNEGKEQKVETLDISLLGNLSRSRRKHSQSGFLMPHHTLTNFETKNYYQNESKFNGVYSRNNLPKIKDRAYVINFDEYESIETHWIVLYVNAINIIYFDSFGIEHNPKEIKKFIRSKNNITITYRIQAHILMFGYFCIVFIGFMLKGKSLLDYTNLFSLNDYEKNDKIILNFYNN